MNTDKTLNAKFVERKDYPVWYYKELKPVEIDYVIWNLLKENFVVDIYGSKHEITFGKNRKHDIGQIIRYDDIENSNLSSYKVVEKGFREGKWYTISDIDTTDEFKANYTKRKEEHAKESTKEMYKSILKNAINQVEKLSEEQRNKHLKELEEFSYEELEELFKSLVKD